MLRALAIDSVIVEFSGGKDSWVILDLCRKVGLNVECGHYHLVPGLEIDERHLRRVEIMGIKVHRLPSSMTAAALSQGKYRPRVNNWADLRIDVQDLHAVLRKRSGFEWVITGCRRDDSWFRRGMFSKFGGGINAKLRQAFPIWNWDQGKVRSYLQHNKLPCPRIIGDFTGQMKSGGVGLDGRALKWLREKWPSDYAKILEVFPFAEAAIIREDMRAQRKAKSDGREG